MSNRALFLYPETRDLGTEVALAPAGHDVAARGP